MTTDSSACGGTFVESVSRSAVRAFRSIVVLRAVRGVFRIALVLSAAMLSLPATAQDVKAAQDGDKPYTVVDGYKVDANTMNGFRAWRAGACDRCHGANQQGLVGPSLVESLKTLSKQDFIKTITDGRLEKGMPSFSTSPTVMQNKDALYAYLKGRSNGDITRAKVEEAK